ncbi:hypothetical protein S245_005043, partial [Arachis hypogaea]
YSKAPDIGCLVSTPKDSSGNRRKPRSIGEVSVYVPSLRIPKLVDFAQSLGDHLSKKIVECLSALRTRIVVMAGQEGPTITRTKRKSATQHGGSILLDLLQALEDYLPVLLGLVNDGSHLQYKVQFVWVNQEDDAEANFLLLPRLSTDGYQLKVSEESRRASVDIFLKAAGYLDCAVKHVLPQLPAELRRNLPVDLAEGTLRALSLQELGQGVDIQLGMAIDSTKATLAVKRRLACEMVKCWQQAQDNIMNLPLANDWGEKHILFVKWKYVEAKAAAYYYHGLILDEGNTEKSHGMAFHIFHESKFLKFLGFMWNPLSWVMEAAAIMAITLANGGGKPPDWQDFVGIITLLVINSTISFIEENNAGNAAAALMARLAPKAKVKFLVHRGQKYKSPGNAFVEGDASSASYFLAGAAVTGGTITVVGCGTSSLQ